MRNDDFAERPISALRFILRSLRRTHCTPRSAGFARLELGALGEAVRLSIPKKLGI
jgi:hypothetical protein